MTKQKLKDFFTNLKNYIMNLRTNRIFMICCLLSIVYLISGYCKWIEIGVSVCALTFMALLPIQSSFCIFMFLHSFTLSNIGYDSCFMVTLIGYCIILFVKYCLGIKKGKYIYHKKLAIIISLFYFAFTMLSTSANVYFGAMLYLTYLPLAFLIFSMRKEFNISQGMNYMFGGLVTSCTLAGIALFFPGFQYCIIQIDRFKGFINNTNYLYMRALFVLSYFMYRYINDSLSHLKFILIFATCSVLTLLTLSKTGIVMLALITLLFVILYLKQDFKKRIKVVGIFALVILLIGLVGFKFIQSIFERFVTSFKSDNFISTLLTNRDKIWELYLDKIFSSPINAIFGHGLLAEQIYVPTELQNTETHNLYIWLLYRFGILGTFVLGYIIYMFIKLLNKNRPKLIAYLPLIYILIESLFDNTMKCYNITYFIFAIMILFMDCDDKSPIANKTETKKEIKD